MSHKLFAMRTWYRLVWCLLVLVSFFGCRSHTPMSPPEARPLKSKAFWLARTALPTFADDLDCESLQQALQRSLGYARRLPPDQVLPFGDRQITARTLVQTLEAFQQVLATASTPTALHKALHEHFEVVQSPGRDERGEVLFTGYYEIELEGSLVPSTAFPYPLYKRPPDLVDAPTTPPTQHAGPGRLNMWATQDLSRPYYTRQIGRASCRE